MPNSSCSRCGDRLRHRRAAARQVAQAGQVEAAVVRAAEQVDDHRRDAGPVRDAGGARSAGRRVRGPSAASARRCCPGRPAPSTPYIMPVMWNIGTTPRPTVSALDMAPQAAADGVGHQRAVRVHAALRQAGRSRRVRQQRQVVGSGGVRAGLAAGGQRVGPARAAVGQRRVGAAATTVHRRRRRFGRVDRASASRRRSASPAAAAAAAARRTRASASATIAGQVGGGQIATRACGSVM